MVAGSLSDLLGGGPAALRPEVVQAAEPAWAAIGGPGTWWTAEQRVAVAAETRAAATCDLCSRRRAAVSPYAVGGDHSPFGPLPAAVVDAVHRIATDPGRLSSRWWNELQAAGIDDARLVEMVAVVALTVEIDALCRALDMPCPSLPGPRPGEPSREVPAGAELHSSRWVRTVVPDKAEGVVKGIYDDDRTIGGVIPHIMRALTLVPADAQRFVALSRTLYPAGGRLVAPEEGNAPLTRPQVELLAATTSSANDCFY